MKAVTRLSRSASTGYIQELSVHEAVHDFLGCRLVAIKERGRDLSGEICRLDQAQQAKQLTDFLIFMVIAQRKTASHL